jgi:demethylmenaquinone methyltransferase/2-methoxy-6-polyprenyl-1,4-benzoquinol methylase
MSSKVTPYAHSSLSKKEQVEAMFDNIAWRYDLLNRVLSFGIDTRWRKQMIAALSRRLPGARDRGGNGPVLLDLATGTADVALAALKVKPAKIFGVDLSEDMLQLGRKKIRDRGLQEKIELLQGDCEKLIFEDNKFDGITVAFGVRNFEHLEKGLSEMLRVLKPGGTCVILEFSHPTNGLIRSLYRFYSARLCPLIGRIISRDQAAYTYLHDSVEAFPYGAAFRDILRKAGFHEVTVRPLTFGVATLYSCRKP